VNSKKCPPLGRKADIFVILHPAGKDRTSPKGEEPKFARYLSNITYYPLKEKKEKRISGIFTKNELLQKGDLFGIFFIV